MLPIPPALQTQFEDQLDKCAIPNSLRGFYRKWLRYYLDFCEKYHFPPAEKQSLPRFIQKLTLSTRPDPLDAQIRYFIYGRTHMSYDNEAISSCTRFP